MLKDVLTYLIVCLNKTITILTITIIRALEIDIIRVLYITITIRYNQNYSISHN